MGEVFDENLLKEQLAESHRRLPGPDYLRVLKWIHLTLRPSLYLEIGVNYGESLQLASPKTKSIGVDPTPRCSSRPNAEIFSMTSDDFFEKVQSGEIRGVQAFSLAFIDGLHTYDQALRDFINLEKLSSPDSVIMLHDCIPLDEISSSNPRSSHFYTGDIWKTLLIIARSRPDLKICIVPTWPSGLVLISSLNPKSDLLQQNFSTLVDQYRSLSFQDYFSTVGDLPPQSPNKRSAVWRFLKHRSEPNHRPHVMVGRS